LEPSRDGCAFHHSATVSGSAKRREWLIVTVSSLTQGRGEQAGTEQEVGAGAGQPKGVTPEMLWHCRWTRSGQRVGS
jgi:hypothetical protein